MRKLVGAVGLAGIMALTMSTSALAEKNICMIMDKQVVEILNVPDGKDYYSVDCNLDGKYEMDFIRGYTGPFIKFPRDSRCANLFANQLKDDLDCRYNDFESYYDFHNI